MPTLEPIETVAQHADRLMKDHIIGCTACGGTIKVVDGSEFPIDFMALSKRYKKTRCACGNGPKGLVLSAGSHARYRREQLDALFEYQEPGISAVDRACWWRAYGERGASAERILLEADLWPSPPEDAPFNAKPHDEDDVQRCRKLLTLIPECRAAVCQLHAADPQSLWNRVIEESPDAPVS